MISAAMVADRLRRRYGQRLGECDLDLILTGEGLILVEWPLADGIKAILFKRWIAIDRGIIDFEERRRLAARLLGHRLLHRAALVCEFSGKRGEALWDKQADAFADQLLASFDERDESVLVSGAGWVWDAGLYEHYLDGSGSSDQREDAVS